MTPSFSRLLVPLVALSLALGAALPAAAAGRTNPHLKEGIQLLSQAEDEKALLQFRKALKRRKNRRSTRAKIHMYLGITYLNLLKEPKAELHFRKALRLRRALKLPPGVSPKISGMVERLRQDLKGAPPPKEPTRTRVRRRAATQPQPRQITPVVQRSDGPSGGVYWPAFVALGVAVAAGGTGLALGLVAKGKADDAHNLATPSGPAVESYDTAERMALTANILYGVAGAAAIASGVLFYWGSQQGKQRRVSSVGVAPTAGGALVQVGGAF
jgi:tetratricopeptide (TPR) repeat protein